MAHLTTSIYLAFICFLQLISFSILPNFSTPIKGEENPPGTIKVEENFFVDINEMSNIDYREYIYWTLNVFGDKSHEYKSALPKEEVCVFQDYAESMHLEYFSSPIYDSYPVVGITLQQAKSYSKWRTDRAAEMRLIVEGLLKPNPDQTPDHHFTIEAYRSGQYFTSTPPDTSIRFAIYSVPTLEDWKIYAGINTTYKFGTDQNTKKNQKVIRRKGTPFNTLDRNQRLKNKQKNKHMIESGSGYAKYKGVVNIHGLNNVIGNVAELIDMPGVAKGGSWLQALEDADIEENRVVNIPSCDIGFRNVARFEK